MTVTAPLWTSQQICPGVQQLSRQHPPTAPHSEPLQGAVPQVPAVQISSMAQSLPQVPQFAESLVMSTQWSKPVQQV
jgi:hypothetical protein